MDQATEARVKQRVIEDRAVRGDRKKEQEAELLKTRFATWDEGAEELEFFGEVPPVKPDMLLTTGKLPRFLLSRGYVHSIFGKSETGKSTAASIAAVQSLNAGLPVLWINFDAPKRSVQTRLKQCGIGTQHARLFRYRESLPADIEAVARLMAGGLVVFDAETSLITRVDPGGNSNSDTSVYKMKEQALDAFTRHGVTVLMIDHTGHAESTQDRERGTAAKRDILDLSYVIKAAEGYSELYLDKDRNQAHPDLKKGDSIARLHWEDNEPVLTTDGTKGGAVSQGEALARIDAQISKDAHRDSFIIAEVVNGAIDAWTVTALAAYLAEQHPALGRQTTWVNRIYKLIADKKLEQVRDGRSTRLRPPRKPLVNPVQAADLMLAGEDPEEQHAEQAG